MARHGGPFQDCGGGGDDSDCGGGEDGSDCGGGDDGSDCGGQLQYQESVCLRDQRCRKQSIRLRIMLFSNPNKTPPRMPSKSATDSGVFVIWRKAIC